MIRVLPRDAFNDANLLKCIGQLTLMIEDGKIDMKYEYDGEAFDIVQDESDGSTYVQNITFYTTDGRRVDHNRPMNSRDTWPLMLYVNGDEYYAFNEKGQFMPSFDQPLREGETPKTCADGDFSYVRAVMPNVLKALDELTSAFHYPKPHEVTYGKRYAKIINDGSVYAFIDAHGNIYKPASWKAPAKHVRGNIFDDANYSIGHAFERYSVRYL